jgi:hypothetical protein
MTDLPIVRRADIAAAHHIGLPLGQLIEAAKALAGADWERATVRCTRDEIGLTLLRVEYAP